MVRLFVLFSILYGRTGGLEKGGKCSWLALSFESQADSKVRYHLGGKP